MHRCAHLYESGRQCTRFAIDDRDFCEDHAILPDTFDRDETSGIGRLVLRIAALVLLIIFLIPFYYTVKSLYATFAVELGDTR
jgi:hypothetical protein